MAKAKVYYNSACPVCAAGIKQQRRKLQGCEQEVEWIDVHSDNEAVAQIGAELEFVRERLHLVDEAGRVQVGSKAFSALWKLTPSQNRLGQVSDLPIIRDLFRLSYNGFAAVLYRWNRLRSRW